MEGDEQKEVAGSTATPAFTAPRASKFVRLPIAGVNVEFPFQPYSVQKYMMSQIITAINKTQNCLLESPTGTGKTLGLLCSSLAWQEKERKMLAELHEELEKEREEQKKLGNKVKAPATPAAPQNEKKGERGIDEVKTSGNSEKDFGCDCSSDEDIFQSPKRKKQSLNSSTSVYDESKATKEPLRTVEDELRENHSNKSCVDDREKCVEQSNQSKENEASESELYEEERKKFTPPTIYYGTRTHKQIAQVVDQLKKTSYANDIRMTILAARDHTCVNPGVKSRPNVTEQCKHLIDPAFGTGCTYYQGATRMQTHRCVQDYGLPVVFDIEDIVVMGAKRKICPYFTLRNLSKISNIVFCPYNYLIHPEMRESQTYTLITNVILMENN